MLPPPPPVLSADQISQLGTQLSEDDKLREELTMLMKGQKALVRARLLCLAYETLCACT